MHVYNQLIKWGKKKKYFIIFVCIWGGITSMITYMTIGNNNMLRLKIGNEMKCM